MLKYTYFKALNNFLPIISSAKSPFNLYNLQGKKKGTHIIYIIIKIDKNE